MPLLALTATNVGIIFEKCASVGDFFEYQGLQPEKKAHSLIRIFHFYL